MQFFAISILIAAGLRFIGKHKSKLFGHLPSMILCVMTKLSYFINLLTTFHLLIPM